MILGEMFSMRLYVPKVMECVGECHSVCENEHYEDIVLKVLGESGYGVSIVNVGVNDLFVVIDLI